MEFLADFGSIERYTDESPCTSHKLEKLTKYRKSISPLSDDCLYKCQIQLFESLFKSAQRQKLTRLFYYSKRRQRACLSCIRVNWKWKVKSNIDWVLSIRREHPLSSSSNSLFFYSRVVIITISHQQHEWKWENKACVVCWNRELMQTQESPHSITLCWNECTFFEFTFDSRVVVYCITHFTSCK